jgi:hypothetical protein
MFCFNSHHQGAFCLCFAEVIIIILSVKIRRYGNHFGRVAAYLSIPYWC